MGSMHSTALYNLKKNIAPINAVSNATYVQQLNDSTSHNFLLITDI